MKPGSTEPPRSPAMDRPTRRAALAVAALAFGGYLLVARAVDNVYPFSTFPMFATRHTPSGSRILARDAAGRLHEVSDAVGWRCDARALDPDACTDNAVYSIPYSDREVIDYVRRHAGDGAAGQSVELVRHVWMFPDDLGAPVTRDCPIARCRAVLR